MFKTRKPITSSQRHLIQLNIKNLKKVPLIKKNIVGLKNTAGRNNSGKITVRHKGGGHKKKYRKIDFTRITNLTAITTSIEYDPNRNAHIASVYNISNNKFFYILAPKNLKIGDIIKSGSEAETKIGHSLPLSFIPTGSYIHNISLNLAQPGKISRAAGTFSQITEKTLSNVKIKLKSGKQKLISASCIASIGIVSNELIFLSQLGKAGQSRWLNRRPTVRGVAMNPVDHPHGGGEGKKSGKRKTPWGKTN